MQNRPKIRFPIWLPAIPIFLLGFALFVTDLTATSLWSDEGWTIAATEEPNPVKIVADWVVPDVHPPLFFLELSIWRLFTGDTIFELRYFPVMISMLGIALIYRLGKALFSTRAGILAALFYALHDLVNVLTHEVRHYPQQMLMVTLALWLYWRFYRNPSRRNGIAFAISGAAMIYTHYWGGFILIGMALHALLTTWGRWLEFRRLAAGFTGIALLYAPWLPVLYHQITLERPGGLPHALDNTNWVYRVLLYQLVGIPEVFWLALAFVGFMGTYAAAPTHWKPSPASSLLLIPAVIAPALSILWNTRYPSLSFRALAVIVPAVIALAAHGLAQFRPREQYVMVAFILIFSLTSTSAGPIERPPWPEIADYIVTHSDATDVVLLENDTDEHALAYYLAQSGVDVAYAYTESTRELHPDEYPAYLAEVLDGANGVWVVKLGWPALSDIRPELNTMGFIQSAPERDYGMYNDRPILLWRLDRPPQAEPRAIFGGELRLLTAETRVAPGVVAVNMLWSPLVTPLQDYTVSVKLFGANGVAAQKDSRPLDGAALTTSWQADGLYFDSIAIPTEGVSSGPYRIGIVVYYLTGQDDPPYVNLIADDCRDDPGCVIIIVDEVVVE